MQITTKQVQTLKHMEQSITQQGQQFTIDRYDGQEQGKTTTTTRQQLLYNA